MRLLRADWSKGGSVPGACGNMEKIADIERNTTEKLLKKGTLVHFLALQCISAVISDGLCVVEDELRVRSGSEI